ncbi:hypothetical protein NBG4_230033 [Candidatus Sulfobium mesophilum]|uniref:Uncharacterized protein n=1 Tax=Candidatus Sulfobium mesophilum TaxID=2016548 RepID=A0A2U3QG83_9BACT|nr:hypothetical protein NBG4_230033 [Candidatus Sulfobium mesophilum]
MNIPAVLIFTDGVGLLEALARNKKRKLEVKMKGNAKVGLIFLFFLTLMCLAFVSAGMAATTENDCINGGGYVSEGSGCHFCIGGKFDLSEVNGPVKDKTSDIKSEKKVSPKYSSQGGDSPARNNQ